MSTESERLAELVTDLGHRLADAFGDVVSPEAQRHLRNAQREALTALFLIYEEQLGRRTGRVREDDDEERAGDGWPRDMEEAVRGIRSPRGDRTEKGEVKTARKARPSRVRKIEVD